MKRMPLIALLAAATLLSACTGDFGAEPIVTGNDRVVVTGGPGAMMGGAVGTLPAQEGQVQSQPSDMQSAPAPSYEAAPVNSSVTGTFQDTNGQLPMPSEQPAAATPVAATPDPACNYGDFKGKPLAEDTVTKLVEQGKFVRELRPGQAITMEHQPNRVNFVVDPKTGNVVDVTCG